MNGLVYVANEGSSNLSVIDPSSGVPENSIPVPGGHPYALAVDAANGNIYVTSYSASNVSIIDPTDGRVVAVLSTGFDPDFIWVDSADGTVYVANYLSGTLSIFRPMPMNYTVTFEEAGLPSGMNWSVDLNGTVQTVSDSSMTFVESSGSYPYEVEPVIGYSASPPVGTIIVSGMNVDLAILFTLNPVASFTVTFIQVGLLTGTTWSVTLGATKKTDSERSINFTGVSNGSYAFSVESVGGSTAEPSSGTVSVNGTNVTQEVEFAPPLPTTYAISFSESGLPGGTIWWVILNQTPKNSSLSTITFYGMNGTYTFTIGVVSGYSGTPSPGSLTVSGAPVGEAVTFISTGGGGSPSSGIAWWVWALIGIVAMVIIASIAVVVMRRKPPAT